MNGNFRARTCVELGMNDNPDITDLQRRLARLHRDHDETCAELETVRGDVAQLQRAHDDLVRMFNGHLAQLHDH